MDFAKDWLKSLLSDAFQSFDSLVNNSVTILSGSDDPFAAGGVWSQVVTLSETLKPFCYIVIGICLLIELAQVAAKVDIIKWEHGLKIAVKMALSKVMIDVAPDFLKACYAQANEWITALGGTSTSLTVGANLATDVSSEVDRISGFFEPLLLCLVVMIPLMAVKLCGLLVQVMAYGRMFELYCLLCISPLPCAFFPLGDGSGGGFSRITRKFLLNFVGVCLQGVMIIVCIKIFNIIMVSAVDNMSGGVGLGSGDAATNISNLCYSMLLGGIVLVMSCAKSGQWAKSVLDA